MSNRSESEDLIIMGCGCRSGSSKQVGFYNDGDPVEKWKREQKVRVCIFDNNLFK